jgi:hypothetical protein
MVTSIWSSSTIFRCRQAYGQSFHAHCSTVPTVTFIRHAYRCARFGLRLPLCANSNNNYNKQQQLQQQQPRNRL